MLNNSSRKLRITVFDKSIFDDTDNHSRFTHDLGALDDKAPAALLGELRLNWDF